MLIVAVVYLLFANIICGVKASSINNTGFSINNQVANANSSVTQDFLIDEDDTNSSGSFHYNDENIDSLLTDKTKTSTTNSPFTFLGSDYGLNEEDESTNLRHVDENFEDLNKTLNKNSSRNFNDSIITNTTLKEKVDETTEESSILINLTNTFIVPPKVKENNSSTTTPETISNSTFSQITTTTKKTPPESSTSVAAFFQSIKWYYWLLLSLIIPAIAIAIGVYCYFRHRQNKTGYAGI